MRASMAMWPFYLYFNYIWKKCASKLIDQVEGAKDLENVESRQENDKLEEDYNNEDSENIEQ